MTGTAPAGATLRVAKEFATPTWAGSVKDRLETTTKVPASGKFTWHVNQSTRPVVQERISEATEETPVREQAFTGGPTTRAQTVDHEFQVTAEDAAEVLDVALDWPTPDDFDLEVLRREADGSLVPVGSSGRLVGEKAQVRIAEPQVGTCVLRVVSFASTSPSYTLTAGLYDVEQVAGEQVPGLVENWTLTCEVAGRVRQTVPVVVDRGGQVRLDVRGCGRA